MGFDRNLAQILVNDNNPSLKKHINIKKILDRTILLYIIDILPIFLG